MENTDKIWIIMGRSLSGELGAEEQQEFNDLIQSDSDLKQQYEMLKKLWDKSYAGQIIVEEENKEKSLFKKIINKAEIERQAKPQKLSETSKTFLQKLFSKRILYAYAASVILAVLFYVSESNTDTINPVTEHVISAQNGSRSKVLLPDGTTVWLNGGSKLYYDFEFSGPQREVRLEGEAFFDVAKQKNRPFIVYAGNINIKVHGTAFNVKFYQGDKNIETTLIHGKIEVNDNSDKSTLSVFLVQNQKLIIPVIEPIKSDIAEHQNFYKVINLDKKIADQERIETAWIYNRIEFRGENFYDLAKRLERWYNVKIEFEDESLKALTFNGSFEKETVDQAFNALQKVGAFNYQIHGREILIKSSEYITPDIKK